MAKADKAINGLDRAKEIISSNMKSSPKTRRLVLANITNAENLIEEQAKRIEEQDERIAIMQESDNLGGLFLELLERWANNEEKLISEFCGSEDREQEERELADGIQDYLKRAGACGLGATIYDIAEGHCRLGLEQQDGELFAVWYTTEDYAEPGSDPVSTGKEIPVFGLKLRDARHAEIISESFRIIAEMIKKGVMKNE